MCSQFYLLSDINWPERLVVDKADMKARVERLDLVDKLDMVDTKVFEDIVYKVAWDLCDQIEAEMVDRVDMMDKVEEMNWTMWTRWTLWTMLIVDMLKKINSINKVDMMDTMGPTLP